MPNAFGPASTTCDFTFEAWVAFIGGDSDCPACIVTSTQTDNDNEWYIRLDGTSDYLVLYSDALSATLASSVPAYDTIVDKPGTWHHVVGQRKNTKVELKRVHMAPNGLISVAEEFLRQTGCHREAQPRNLEIWEI